MSKASTLQTLPPAVQKGFRRYYYRKRTYAAIRILLSALVLYVLLVWLAIHLDRFSFLTMVERARLVRAVHGIAGVFAALRVLWLFLKKLPVKGVAYALEAKLGPDVEERYSTLVDLLNRDADELNAAEQQLVAELVEDTLKRDQHRRTARLAGDRTLLRWLAASVVMVLLFFLPSLLWPYQLDLMLKRFYLPLNGYPKPSFVAIELMPTAEVVGLGREFVLQVKTQGRVPRPWIKLLKLFGRELSVDPQMHLRAATGTSEKRELTRVGEDRYLFTQTNVREGFQYRLRCGDAETEWSSLEVVRVPRVTEITLDVTPPVYSRLEGQTVLFRGQSLLFLKGTRVRLVFKTDQAIATRTIISDILEKPIDPIWDEEARTGTYVFVLRDKVTLRIKVANERGFENTDPAVVSLGLLEDRPPSAFLKEDEVLRERAATDQVALPFHVADDYGVAEIAVSYIVNPAPGQMKGAKEVKLPLVGQHRKLSQIALFDLRAANAYPGDRILLRLRARDTAGQSALSQGVLIDISSFGRGAREEVRIRTLRFLAKAIERATESATLGDDPETAALHISDGIFRRIAEEAKANGVFLAKKSSFLTLFEALEREHFLTGSPWDKEDLRHIHAAMVLAGRRTIGASDPVELRNEMVLQVVEDILTPMLDYRELKNVMWRCFGLRRAAAALAASQRPVARDKSKLIFTTLEKSLARLLKVAARIKSLDAAKLRVEINAMAEIRRSALGEKKDSPAGEFNEGAWDEGELIDEGADARPTRKKPRGPAASKLELKRLATRLGNVLALEQAAVLEALHDSKEARQYLGQTQAELFSHLLARPDRRSDPDDWWRRVMQFLDGDARLARANPYPPLWPLVANHLLSSRLLEANQRRWDEKMARKFVGPPSPLVMPEVGDLAPKVFSRYERGQDELFIYSSLATLERHKDVSAIEKEFAARLLVIELAERHAKAAAGDASALLGLSLDRQPSAPTPFRTRPESVCRAAADYLELEGELRAALLELVAATPAAEAVKKLPPGFQVTSRWLGNKVQAKHAIVLERQLVRCFVERFYLELTALPAGDTPTRPLELLYLKLREFRERPPASLHHLEEAPGEGQLSPRHFDDVDIDMRQLGNHRRAVYAKVNDMIKRFQEGRAQKLNDYQRVLAGELEKTAYYVTTCTELGQAADQEGVAKEYIGNSEEATMAYLSASLFRLRAVTALLQRARNSLDRRAKADGAFLGLVAQAREALEQYVRILALARPSEFKEQVATTLQNLGARLQRLGADPGNANAAVYETANIIEKLQDVTRELDTYSVRIGKLRFTGGGGLASKGISAVRVFETGKRLADHVEFHRERVSACIFELLEDKPRAEVCRLGLPHAAFAYRMVRSDLARFRPLEPILPAERPPNYVGYLRAVLQQAAKIKITQYKDSIPPYLRQMGRYRWKLPKKKKK